MARHIDALPRRKVAEDIVLELRHTCVRVRRMSSETSTSVATRDLRSAMRCFESASRVSRSTITFTRRATSERCARRAARFRRRRRNRANARASRADPERATTMSTSRHLEEEFGGLKVVGQFLTNRLLDHAAAGKADRRLCASATMSRLETRTRPRRRRSSGRSER